MKQKMYQKTVKNDTMEGEEETKNIKHSTQWPKHLSKDFAFFTEKKEIPKKPS
jgi:hypothetical protein